MGPVPDNRRTIVLVVDAGTASSAMLRSRGAAPGTRVWSGVPRACVVGVRSGDDDPLVLLHPDSSVTAEIRSTAPIAVGVILTMVGVLKSWC